MRSVRLAVAIEEVTQVMIREKFNSDCSGISTISFQGFSKLIIKSLTEESFTIVSKQNQK